MTVKTVSAAEETQNDEYPVIKIGRKKGTIILFNAENTGTVIDSGESEHVIGKFSKGWKEKYFDVYDEQVLIEND